MALSLNSISSSSCLHTRTGFPQPYRSCATNVSVGLRLQSPSSFGIAKPNLNVELYKKVHKSIEYRTCSKPKRGRVVMMSVWTPMVPYKTPGERSWQWIDLWNALYRERIIFLGDYIDEESSNQLLSTILYLDSISSTEMMCFYVCCSGGDLTPTMALYDTIHSLESPIGTLCLGYAFSMAGFILAAGDKGHRIAMPNSWIILNPPAGAARGQADDVQNEAAALLKIRDYLYKELSLKTGQPLDKIHHDLRRRKAFDAKEALEYGLIDTIYTESIVAADEPGEWS